MATKLTKKQQTQLTEKLTGIIQKNNALQLRMSMDNSVNEMNVNQISGALNRIHGQAIGKDLPTEISIPVKQLGSGDPSPDNIRPVVGYVIDGIGTVYGGELNVNTGVLRITTGQMTLNGSERWLMSGSSGYTEVNQMAKLLNYNDAIKCDKLLPFAYGFQMPNYSVTGYRDQANSYPNQNWIYIKIDSEHITAVAFQQWLAQNPAVVIYPLATAIEYTLTPEQMIQLLDQL